MSQYSNYRVRHLPYGCWICSDKSVIVFSRLYIPLFKFEPRKGVTRIEGVQDTPAPDDCVAELQFRYDGWCSEGTDSFKGRQTRQLEDSYLKWSIAADTTKHDPKEARKMKRPPLPSTTRRYVSPGAKEWGKAVLGTISKIASAYWEPAEDFDILVFKRQQPPHPKRRQAVLRDECVNTAA